MQDRRRNRDAALPGRRSSRHRDRRSWRRPHDSHRPDAKERSIDWLASTVYRQEVRPFSDKHIELLSNFAAQAVIAIENTRLLNELRQRTDDLSEALEQQTAASDVLRVISGSPSDVEPVFQVMLENAVRICQAKFGSLYLYDGESFCVGALHNAPPAFAEFRSVNRCFIPHRIRDLHRSSQQGGQFMFPI